MVVKKVARTILPPILFDAMRSMKRALAYRRYMAGGGTPFGIGYGIHHKQFIMNVLNNSSLLARFRRGEPLPPGYGVGIDERCVEYPWMIGQLDATPGSLLDAGSTLNHDFLIDLPILQAKVIHILTLAPEEECFWQRNISYMFHDLRNIPIRDNYYDTISCLSTLEHVGCDNTNYTGNDSDRENHPADYLVAIEELCRVLRPGGSLLITIPFGTYCHLGVQQQFDGRMLARAIETLAKCGEVIERFYRYSADGWNLATLDDCTECRYVEWAASVWAHGKVPNPIPIEPDHAIAARAVACLRLNKRTVAPV
jgi:SAM-dependent methyltransferase